MSVFYFFLSSLLFSLHFKFLGFENQPHATTERLDYWIRCNRHITLMIGFCFFSSFYLSAHYIYIDLESSILNTQKLFKKTIQMIMKILNWHCYSFSSPEIGRKLSEGFSRKTNIFMKINIFQNHISLFRLRFIWWFTSSTP